ncbi:uncharacterized protein KY384_003971 [Bacidia gigantensis]|uniref:uncharacterized protein n=1 Tax=Bacidia gigantensis TaxID=2732470 RepID=UPI001D04657D|nr:uncharacterized protein KY384_003971 [Bacidia gigantensis]KAG8532330.1 hypothetical protein KY384_003971 [Bacidia gigantensis]
MIEFNKGWALAIEPAEFIARIKAYEVSRPAIDELHDLERCATSIISKLPHEILNNIIFELVQKSYRQLIEPQRKVNDCCERKCIHEGRLKHLDRAEELALLDIENLIDNGDMAGLETQFLRDVGEQREGLCQLNRVRHYTALSTTATLLKNFQARLKLWRWPANHIFQAINDCNIRPILRFSRNYLKDYHDTWARADDENLDDYDDFINSIDVKAYLLLPLDDDRYHWLRTVINKNKRLCQYHDLLMLKHEKNTLLSAAQVLKMIPPKAMQTFSEEQVQGEPESMGRDRTESGTPPGSEGGTLSDGLRGRIWLDWGALMGKEMYSKPFIEPHPAVITNLKLPQIV